MGAHELVAASCNGHRHVFEKRVKVTADESGREVIVVDEAAYPSGDASEEMLGGHLAALAEWIEDE
jgi:hypothetical protein